MSGIIISIRRCAPSNVTWHWQVLTAVGYHNKRPLFPDYIDKDIVVRLQAAALSLCLHLMVLQMLHICACSLHWYLAPATLRTPLANTLVITP